MKFQPFLALGGALLFAATGCKKQMPEADVAKVVAAVDNMCACTKLPMEVAPLEACQKKASDEFEATAKSVGANNWGYVADSEFDDATVQKMAHVADLYKACVSNVGNAVVAARTGHP